MNASICQGLFEKQFSKIPVDVMRSRGWEIISASFPFIDIKFVGFGKTPLRLKLDFSNWNALPPSITILSDAGEELKQLGVARDNVFNPNAHHNTGKPFVCAPGSREYHTHSSHLTDKWENYMHKSDYDLGGIISKLWFAWKRGGA